jgi:hypothetical protein
MKDGNDGSHFLIGTFFAHRTFYELVCRRRASLRQNSAWIKLTSSKLRPFNFITCDATASEHCVFFRMVIF